MMSTVNRIIAMPLLVFMALVCTGCAGGGKDEPAASPGADTLQEEVISRISKRVLREVPDTGRLKAVRDREVLRVALPPPEPPFQALDPELGAPTGFTPALVGEISLILGVKPNIEILESAPSPPGFPAGWEDKYDLLAMPEGNGGCPVLSMVKYYYAGPEAGWKIFCVAGDSGSMVRAIENVFSYLNETGIYIRLYRDYVEE